MFPNQAKIRSTTNPITPDMCKIDKRLNRWKKIEREDFTRKMISTNESISLKMVKTNIKKDPFFRLIDLPHLARIEVIRQMTNLEIIRLALASKRMESYVKQARISKKCFTAIVDGPETRIAIEGVDTISVCSPSTMIPENHGLVKIEINLADLNTPKMERVLNETTFKDYNKLTIRGGQIEAEELDFVMKTAVIGKREMKRFIKIEGTEIPLDYRHKNAFRFSNIHYGDARWVRIENLLSLKSRVFVSLGRNNFTMEDVNTYVNYWINSEHDMTRALKIARNEDGPAVFEGFLMLRAAPFRRAVYLVSSNSERIKRKRQLLIITIAPKMVIITENAPNDQIPINLVPRKTVSFEQEFEVLRCLNRLKMRHMELEQVEKELMTIEEEEKAQELNAKKAEIKKEIEKITKQLDDNGVYKAHGIYHLSERRAQ